MSWFYPLSSFQFKFGVIWGFPRKARSRDDPVTVRLACELRTSTEKMVSARFSRNFPHFGTLFLGVPVVIDS